MPRTRSCAARRVGVSRNFSPTCRIKRRRATPIRRPWPWRLKLKLRKMWPAPANCRTCWQNIRHRETPQHAPQSSICCCSGNSRAPPGSFSNPSAAGSHSGINWGPGPVTRCATKNKNRERLPAAAVPLVVSKHSIWLLRGPGVLALVALFGLAGSPTGRAAPAAASFPALNVPATGEQHPGKLVWADLFTIDPVVTRKSSIANSSGWTAEEISGKRPVLHCVQQTTAGRWQAWCRGATAVKKHFPAGLAM